MKEKEGRDSAAEEHVGFWTLGCLFLVPIAKLPSEPAKPNSRYSAPQPRQRFSPATSWCFGEPGAAKPELLGQLRAVGGEWVAHPTLNKVSLSRFESDYFST